MSIVIRQVRGVQGVFGKARANLRIFEIQAGALIFPDNTLEPEK
jgi:hypothetical protein